MKEKTELCRTTLSWQKAETEHRFQQNICRPKIPFTPTKEFPFYGLVCMIQYINLNM
jgi:hypothetical protein